MIQKCTIRRSQINMNNPEEINTVVYTTEYCYKPVQIINKGKYFSVQYINPEEKYSFTGDYGANGEREVLSEYIRILEEVALGALSKRDINLPIPTHKNAPDSDGLWLAFYPNRKQPFKNEYTNRPVL